MVNDKHSIMICPICYERLERHENSMLCTHGHSFDISRRGYVNLLTGNRKNHGDNRDMILARDAFLSCGAYSHLADEIVSILSDNLVCKAKNRYDAKDGQSDESENVIIDSGCGSGYYTNCIENGLTDLGIPHSIYAYDVSKDAVQCTASKNKNINLCVASVFSMPYSDGCADAVCCIFSPLNIPEFRRVLKPGGLFIEVIPNPEHLIELKRILYEHPYENTVSENGREGFDLLFESNVKRTVNLNANETANLFAMTPYFYRTSIEGRERLHRITSLSVNADFKILVYAKKH